MDTNVRIVGWLQIALHALTLVAGVLIFLLAGAMGALVATQGGHDGLAAMGILGGIGTFFLIFCTVISLPGIVIGWGILNLKPWARPLGIVLAILEILHLPPFGLALGIYTLVVLFDTKTVALFDRASARLA